MDENVIIALVIVGTLLFLISMACCVRKSTDLQGEALRTDFETGKRSRRDRERELDDRILWNPGGFAGGGGRGVGGGVGGIGGGGGGGVYGIDQPPPVGIGGGYNPYPVFQPPQPPLLIQPRPMYDAPYAGIGQPAYAGLGMGGGWNQAWGRNN